MNAEARTRTHNSTLAPIVGLDILALKCSSSVSAAEGDSVSVAAASQAELNRPRKTDKDKKSP